jgi:muramoyltetrapeptide carboxypeptidase LdcA involved in peptidoglycan recycling
MMPVRFPRSLQAGSLVAVISPSSGVRSAMHGRLDAALAALRAAGYRVREGRFLRRQEKGASARATERAAELMDALLDPEVAAVIPPWGGERAMEVLPHLDFDRLAAAEPKWFSGFSDLSTIQVPLLLRAGWASLHGPNLMQLAEPALDETTARVFDAWRLGPGATFSQPAAEATTWRLFGAAGEPPPLRGRLVGGCLDAISRLAGSAFGDIARFGAAHREEGTIVFLENAELRPFELARALGGLRHAGWFDRATGVLIGRNAAASRGDAGDFGDDDAIDAALGGLGCPVLLDVDIGHVAPQWSLVQGARGIVEWIDGRGTLTQSLD